MGTDIHAFVEFDISQDEPFSVAENVRSLSSAELFLRRDYKLFDLLAGGRACVDGRTWFKPMFPPRGLPMNCTREVVRRYGVTIDANCNLSQCCIPVPEIPRSRIADFLEKAKPLSEVDGSQLFENQNWRNPSWLLLCELKDILAGNAEIKPSTFLAILAAMETLESEYGEHRTRLVFWFDN